jgi:hypothetical protein
MTPQFDFAAWVGRAQRFVVSLENTPGFELDGWLSAPPLSAKEIEAQTADALALFPNETSIYGGPELGPVNALPDYLRSCGEWAKMFEDAREEDESQHWGSALPVIAVSNGDYVALEGSTPMDDDPPVIYLSHEGQSARLAESFTAFLGTWERLCYLGPEIWMLETFRGPDGLLSPDLPAVARLRRLLGKQ